MATQSCPGQEEMPVLHKTTQKPMSSTQASKAHVDGNGKGGGHQTDCALFEWKGENQSLGNVVGKRQLFLMASWMEFAVSKEDQLLTS